MAAGYSALADVTHDVALSDDLTMWRKRFHASADPGRPTHVHLRVDGWPGQRFALLFRDWLIAEPAVRDEYLAVKRAAVAAEPWFDDAYRRAWTWAEQTGWVP